MVATVGLMLSVAIVSGPLVDGVDLTPEAGSDHLVCDLGTATVSVEDPPSDRVTIERERFGAETYAITADDAIVSVEGVDGCPRLVYRIQVPELGVDTRQMYFLEGIDEEELTISAPVHRFDPDEIQQETYRGTVSLELQGEQNRVLYESNVTVTVVE